MVKANSLFTRPYFLLILVFLNELFLQAHFLLRKLLQFGHELLDDILFPSKLLGLPVIDGVDLHHM